MIGISMRSLDVMQKVDVAACEISLMSCVLKG